jgi:hypothetical protein
MTSLSMRASVEQVAGRTTFAPSMAATVARVPLGAALVIAVVRGATGSAAALLLLFVLLRESPRRARGDAA